MILLADDLGWNDVGWNNPRVRTPNLDRLCAEGVRLEQNYVLPMCTPTRASLLTGRYASRFGVTSAQNGRVLPFETVTLARALKDSGYDTALVGKWHLGSAPEWGPNRFGFDHSYGLLAGGSGPYSHLYKAGPYKKTWHRNGEWLEEEGHVTDLLAAEAERWIGARGEDPFLLYVAFTAPHVPVAEPVEWRSLYSEKEKWLQRHPKGDLPAKVEYYAAVSHMDAAIGRIVEALDRSGKRSNTIVIFMSDNGASPHQPNTGWPDTDDPREQFVPGPAGGSNEPLRGQKTQVYEGGIRVPAFVNWPGRLRSGEHAGVVHVVDWMPTLCGLAGAKPAANLKWDGTDVWSELSGAAEPAPRRLYWVGTDSLTSAVRDEDWKLVHTRQTYHSELFDLSVDPKERTDLAAQFPERVTAMRDLLAEFAGADNDAVVEDETVSSP